MIHPAAAILSCARRRKRIFHEPSCLICLMVVTSFLACNANTNPEPRLGLKVDNACPSSDASDYYYPPATIVANDRGQDNFLREWFSRYLRVAEAAPLWCGGSTEAYRFLWLPSYRPAMLIELTKGNGDWQLTRIAFNDPRDTVSGTQANPLGVNARNELRVSGQSVAPFLQALGDASYWTGPAYISSNKEDGHRWLIEARRRDLYRVVTRREAEDVKFEDAARALTKLAGFDIPDEMTTRE